MKTKKTESESRVNGDLVQMFFFWEGSPNNSSKTMHRMIVSAETSAGNCCEPGTGPFSFLFLTPVFSISGYSLRLTQWD